MPDGSYSVSDIQDYTEYIIKNHETLTAIPPICVYVIRINNRLVFEIKDGCKLELQTPETIKLFGSTKKSMSKKNRKEKKNGENISGREVVEVVFVQCNLVDNQYQ